MIEPLYIIFSYHFYRVDKGSSIEDAVFLAKSMVKMFGFHTRLGIINVDTKVAEEQIYG